MSESQDGSPSSSSQLNETVDGPEVFLVIPNNDPAYAGFCQDPWAQRWSAIKHPPTGADVAPDAWILERFGPFLRLFPQMPPPQPVGAHVGVAVSELDQLQAACSPGSPWAFVVFQPSHLACLDQLRKGRQTLVAARALAPGDIIGTDDVALVQGGLGLDAVHKERVLGCGLCYPLQRGEAITFGFLQWMEQTP